LGLLRELGDKAGISSTLFNFGSFLNEEVGRPDEALPLLREALQIRRETGNANGEALVLNNLGTYYQVKRQYVEAQAHFELALKIREKGGAPRDIADVLHNLAATLVRRGQYDQSRADYLRARDLRRKVGDRAGESIETYSIGTIYDDQGHVGSAVEWKENALTLFRGLERKDFWLVEMLSGVGRSLVLSGRTDDAIKYLDEAMGLARELGKQDFIAAATASHADRLYYSGDVKGAYNLSEQAVQAAGTSKNRERVLHGQAIRAIADGSLRPSRDSAARLATISREADAVGLKALAIECSIHRADTLSKLGNLAGARQEAEDALEQAEMFGLRLSLAKAHLVHAGTVRERDGDCAAASRILDAIRAEPGSEHLLKRFDLTELVPACAR
jgi:tetratricopeptide (TPR) repeat protein